MSGRHVALIVEDDPFIADNLKELVTSLDHEWRHASTLEEVRAAIAAGGYCYVLLDMQIPADATVKESVGCGETALRLLRRKAPERNARDKHVLPILVVTGYSSKPDFVSKVHKEGANDFIAKPFGPLDLVLDKIREALRLAEREEHEECEAAAKAAREAAAAEEEAAAGDEMGDARGRSTAVSAALRFVIDGTYMAQRSRVIVNDVTAWLPDAHFLVLVSAIAVHVKTPSEWESATKLAMARNPWATSRIVTALKDVLPAGFRVIEANKPARFRLNPAIVIERVEWGALGKHPNAGVRKVAGEVGKG